MEGVGEEGQAEALDEDPDGGGGGGGKEEGGGGEKKGEGRGVREGGGD